MRQFAVVLIVMSWTSATRAGNWPGWRGPTGQGVSVDKDEPLTWSKTENVR